MDFSICRLGPERREELLAVQDECTIGWSNAEGWPVAVVQTYVWHEGSFWVTAFRDKPRVAAWQADPRASVTVSSAGTPMGPEKMVTARVVPTFHDDEATLSWFYPAFAARAVDDEAARPLFAKAISRQDRVVVELAPVSWTSFDGQKLREAAARPRS